MRQCYITETSIYLLTEHLLAVGSTLNFSLFPNVHEDAHSEPEGIPQNIIAKDLQIFTIIFYEHTF